MSDPFGLEHESYFEKAFLSFDHRIPLKFSFKLALVTAHDSWDGVLFVRRVYNALCALRTDITPSLRNPFNAIQPGYTPGIEIARNFLNQLN